MGPISWGDIAAEGTGIAYEVAQQLRAQGEEVGLLALFDTLIWSRFTRTSVGSSKAYHGIQRVLFHGANVLSLDSRGMWKFISGKAKLLRNRIPVWKGMLLARIAKCRQRIPDSGNPGLWGQIWETNDRASPELCSQTVSRHGHGFSAQEAVSITDEAGREMGRPGAGRGQDVIVLPVYPAGMLVEPFVQHLATALRKSHADRGDRALRPQPNFGRYRFVEQRG